MYNNDRISAAFAIAARVHAQQVRTFTAIPYISHPMAVAAQVAIWGGDENQFIAALLHDVLEDGGAQYKTVIEKGFGDEVLELVMACSDAAPLPGEEKSPWQQRKTEYIEHLKMASDEALLVSAADKWHNLTCIFADAQKIGNEVFLRFVKDEPSLERKRTKTLWYYSSLIHVYYDRNLPVAKEVDRVFQQILDLPNKSPENLS